MKDKTVGKKGRGEIKKIVEISHKMNKKTEMENKTKNIGKLDDPCRRSNIQLIGTPQKEYGEGFSYEVSRYDAPELSGHSKKDCRLPAR